MPSHVANAVQAGLRVGLALGIHQDVVVDDDSGAAQYVNSDGVLQQCILCHLDIASYLFAVNKEW